MIYAKNFTGKVFQNAKPFLKFPIFSFGIFEIFKNKFKPNDSQIFSKNSGFWKTGHTFCHIQFSGKFVYSDMRHKT